jgi:hypothetical protein
MLLSDLDMEVDTQTIEMSVTLNPAFSSAYLW